MRFSKSPKSYLLAGALAVGSSAALVVGLLLPGSAGATVAHKKSTTVTYWITWYGWPDNSPPGAAIAHQGCKTPGGQTVNHAEGVGTFNFPVTYADPQHLSGPWCQIIYVPKFKKYFEHEDQCNPCGGQNSKHFDLWMGGTSNSNPQRRAILNCENKGTGTTQVILNPPNNEPVDSTPAFSPPTTCNV